MSLSPFAKAVWGAAFSGFAAGIGSLTTAAAASSGHLTVLDYLIAAGLALSTAGGTGGVVYTVQNKAPEPAPVGRHAAPDA
jgi:hypothetical protein